MGYTCCLLKSNIKQPFSNIKQHQEQHQHQTRVTLLKFSLLLTYIFSNLFPPLKECLQTRKIQLIQLFWGSSIYIYIEYIYIYTLSFANLPWPQMNRIPKTVLLVQGVFGSHSSIMVSQPGPPWCRYPHDK